MDFPLDFDNDAHMEKALQIAAGTNKNAILFANTYLATHDTDTPEEQTFKKIITSGIDVPSESEKREGQKALDDIKPLVDELAAELGIKHISPKTNVGNLSGKGHMGPKITLQ